MKVDLPRGWTSAAMDQVFEPRSSRVSPDDFPESPYVGLEHVEAHSSKLLGTVPAATMSSSAARFLAGDVLYGRMRPYLNKVILLPFDGLASAEFIVFPETVGVNSRFLLWRLLSNDFVEFACSQYEGDRPRVKFDQLGKFQLHLPPRAEQTRIVEKLEELLSDLDAGVAELKAAQKKLIQYRQSLLKAAVEGALTADWRAAHQANDESQTGAQLLARILTERRSRWETRQLAKFQAQGKTPPKDWQAKYPEPVAPDSAGLPALPLGWVWATVEQLGDVQLGRQRSPDKVTGLNPAPYIRAANITEQGIDFSDVLEMDFTDRERETFRLKSGDVLLTEASGSPQHVGRPVIWPNVEGLYCFQNTVIRFSPLGITSEFAFQLFLAWQKLGVFRRLSGGVGINHLSAGKFSALAVPLPPVPEQTELVRALSVAFESLASQEQTIEYSLKQSTAQRKNILQAAFSGQLVPPDPADEPASALLARIRAERAAREAGSLRGRGKKKVST